MIGDTTWKFLYAQIQKVRLSITLASVLILSVASTSAHAVLPKVGGWSWYFASSAYGEGFSSMRSACQAGVDAVEARQGSCMVSNPPNPPVPCTWEMYLDEPAQYCAAIRNSATAYRIYLGPPSSCPDNSTLVNGGCVCNAGYAEDLVSNTCIPGRPEMCPVPSGGQAGQPIEPASQSKVRDETDWSGQGPAPLIFSRHYQSTWGMDASRAVGSMGKAWSHNHATSLKLSTVSTGSSVSITTGAGYLRTFFNASGASQWTATNSNDTLSQLSTGEWSYRRASDDAVLVFGKSGQHISTKARNGWVTSYGYNASGQLASISNGFGQAISLGYNASGQLVSVTAPGNEVTGYSYDSSGRLSRVTYPDTRTRSFLYENASFPHALTGIVDETGARWGTFSYDAVGRAASTELAEATSRYQVGYASTLAGATAVTTRTFNYSLNLGKLVVTGADKPSGLGQPDAASRVQSPLGLVTAETDFRGTTTTYAWDTNRRLPTSTTEAIGTAEGRTTVTEWHPQFRLPLTVTEPGRTTAYTYDGLGNRLTQTVTDTGGGTTNGVARTTGWTYHPSGLVATETAPNGAITRFAYDALGNLTSSVNALGHTDTYTHDGAGRVLTHTAPTGLVTTYTYDARGRMLTMARAGLVTTLTYRPSGQVATAAMPHGHVITYTYDAAQRLTGWSDNRGASGTYVLDGMGNRLSEQVRNAQGQVVWKLARSINSLNRVASLQTGTAGAPVNYQYDANGDLISTTQTLEGSPLASGVTLDALRRVKTLSDANSATAALTYNALDDITAASDFKGVTTAYTRDALGNAPTEASPDSGTQRATYDSLGLPRQVTDAMGRATTITRDALGRPTVLQYADGTRTTLRYDLPGTAYNASGAALASVGYLSEVQDPGVTTTLRRDILGRITRKSQVLTGGETRAVTYSYRAAGTAGAGQLATITYPSGKQLSHSYNSAGRLTAMNWAGQPLVTNITWNPLGQPTGWRWAGFASAPGSTQILTEARTYTDAAQLASSGITSAYTYDRTGRLTASAHSATPTQALPSGWSLSDIIGPNSMGYAYDANGNRTQAFYSITTAGGTTTVRRDVQASAGTNRVTGYTQTDTLPGSTTGQVSTVAFTLDTGGSITRMGDTYLHYSPQGRIARTSLNPACPPPPRPQSTPSTQTTTSAPPCSVCTATAEAPPAPPPRARWTAPKSSTCPPRAGRCRSQRRSTAGRMPSTPTT